MCEANLLTKIISISYLCFCIAIPLFYLYKFVKYKSRKKNYFRAFIIALTMFLILFSIKLIVNLDNKNFKCLNCYINNKCDIKSKESDDEVDNKKESTTTTTSTATTTTTTSTTRKTTTASSGKYNYPKIAEPNGEKKEVGKTSNGYTIYEINGVTYIDGFLIVNKTYALPSGYEPDNTYKSAKGVSKVCNNCINNTAYKAWLDMKADAAAIGLNLWIQSGYRPYVSQENIYNNYVKRDGQSEADTYSARPGHSEHQTAECFDINNPSRSFNGTKEAKWIAENAYKYGFIIRYPQGKTDETGYMYESWHVRYVGTDMSYKLYNNGDWITMESYYGITSKYQE